MKTWRDLIKAARVKVQLGWVQGRPQIWRPHAPDAYCILGALDDSARELHPIHHASSRAAVRRIALAAGTEGTPEPYQSDRDWVIHFNDHPRTTQEDVLKLLDQAAEGK